MAPREATHTKRFLAIVSVLLLFLALCTRFLYLYLDDASRFPIETIKVVSHYQHITRQQIQSILEPYQDESFYTFPIHQVYQQLKSLNWIAEVEIARRFPNTIQIILKERQPIALWNEQIVTEQGDLFSDAQALATYSHLPRLSGPAQESQRVLNMYRAMQTILTTNQLQISALACKDNFAWELTLTNGIEIKLGKQDPLKRLLRFNQAYPLLSSQPAQLLRADLRYPKGMALKWQ